jgi:hypothetical protein
MLGCQEINTASANGNANTNSVKNVMPFPYQNLLRILNEKAANTLAYSTRRRGQIPRGHGLSQKPSVPGGEAQEYVDISSRADAEVAVSGQAPQGLGCQRPLPRCPALKENHSSCGRAPCRGL